MGIDGLDSLDKDLLTMIASALRGAFQSALTSSQGREAAMEQLLRATRARAVGLWLLHNGGLELWGFAACPEMTPGVGEAFAAATRRVELTQTGLGIVRAATTLQPAVATLQPELTGLPGSASWIERFGARESLSVPLLSDDGRLLGALAVSTAEPLTASGEVWQLVVELAGVLAHELS